MGLSIAIFITKSPNMDVSPNSTGLPISHKNVFCWHPLGQPRDKWYDQCASKCQRTPIPSDPILRTNCRGCHGTVSPKWRERRCPGRLSRRPRSTSRQLGDSLCTGAWTWNTREARFGLPRYRVKLREAWGGKKTFQWPVFHPHIDNHWNWLSKSEFVNVWLRNPFLYRKKRFQGNPL